MLRFKKLFSLNSNVALSYVSKINVTKVPMMHSRSLLMLNALKNPGSLTRCYSSRKWPPTDDRPERLVALKHDTFEEELDETKSSNPILILHGLLGSKDHWSSIAKQLNRKTGRKVLTVDIRNHGASPHTVHFSYEIMACDLILFLRTKQIPKATIIGHSLGGRIAMMVAMRYPELVRSLIVVDISPFGNSPCMLAISKMLKDIKNLDLDRHYTINEARKQAAAQLKKKKYDEKMIAFLLSSLVPNEFNTNWRWKFNLDSIIKNYERDVVFFPIVNSPCLTRTLFLGGGNSDYICPREESAIKRIFPVSEFKYIEGAGHWLHVDKPAEFFDIVTAFVDKDPTRLQEEVEKYPIGKPVKLAYAKYDDHLDDTKSNIPIVILHGLLGSKENWHSMAIQLNQKLGRPIYVMDARNHGDSPHAELFTYELMVHDVLSLLHKLKITKISLVGHSMGGRTAMMLAMMYPVAVESLVVVDISPLLSSRSIFEIKTLLQDIKDLNLDPKLTVKEARKEVQAKLSEKVYDDRIVAFLLNNIVENSGRANWRWKFNLDSILRHFDTEIVHFIIMRAPLPIRTLFIAGSESDHLKPQDEPEIKWLLPKARFTYVQGAGHWIHADKPAEFIDIVTNFVESDPKLPQSQVGGKNPLCTAVDLKFQVYDEVLDKSKPNTPIVILHGLLGSKQNWNTMASQLNVKLGRRVYTLDARNHGESPHTDEFNYELMMVDVLSFLQNNGISKATLIGHSMGGRTAMMLTMMFPMVVKSLVVVDISPIGSSPNLLGIKTLLQNIKDLNLNPKLTVTEARKEAFAKLRENVKDDRIIAFLLTNLVESNMKPKIVLSKDDAKTTWRWRFNVESICENFEKEMVNFTVVKAPLPTRTLFVGGSNSDYLKPEEEPEIKKLLPNCSFTYVEGAGHWVHAERPNDFLHIVSAFIEKDKDDKE